jgi:hypothetical protein
MEYIKDFRHTLVQPFEYSFNGTGREAKEILMLAPTSKLDIYIAPIEEEVGKEIHLLKTFKDIKEEEKKGKEKIDDNDKALSIVSLLASVGDMKKCYDNFKNILKDKKSCYIDPDDSRHHFVQETVDKLSHLDMKLLLGRYIDNFLSTSPKN